MSHQTEIIRGIVEFGTQLQACKGTIIHSLKGRLRMLEVQSQVELRYYRVLQEELRMMNSPEQKYKWVAQLDTVRNRMSSLKLKRVKAHNTLKLLKGL